MTVSINFYSEFKFSAIKIDNEVTDAVLTAKLTSFNLLTLEFLPNNKFSFCHVLPKLLAFQFLGGSVIELGHRYSRVL